MSDQTVTRPPAEGPNDSYMHCICSTHTHTHTHTRTHAHTHTHTHTHTHIHTHTHTYTHIHTNRPWDGPTAPIWSVMPTESDGNTYDRFRGTIL